MKKSIDRVYDAAVLKGEEMAIKQFEKGRPSHIDTVGPPWDQYTNKHTQAIFDAFVATGIIRPGEGQI